MSRIVRLWLYRITEELEHPELKISKTNQHVTRVVRGDFEYYEFDGEKATRSSRKAAMKYIERTGLKIETIRGYPAFMHDQGYRI